MSDIIREYIKAHPQMETSDLIKFCHQSVMGPGHMAPERHAAARYAQEELSLCGPRENGQPLVQMLEGFGARLDLDCGISPQSIAGLFCMTAGEWPPSDAARAEEMALDCAAFEELPFSGEELARAAAQWRKEGRPAVSHSQRYKSFYRAHYRVVMKSFLPYLKAISAIEALSGRGAVAIDGMCGSGKTTMARVLGKLFDAPVVHMDDFFLPFEMKTPERMAQPGGNVHYERFISEVSGNIKSGRAFEYGVYDCSVGCISGTRRVEKSPLVIVEGSYCQNPHIGDIYDLKIFVETDPGRQAQRILSREGPKGLEAFTSRWIPLENKYFSAFGIKEKCDVVVTT